MVKWCFMAGLITGLLTGILIGTYLESWISDDTQTPLDEWGSYPEPLNGTSIISYKNSCSQLNLSDVEENPFSPKERRVWVDGIVFRKYEFESINRTVPLMVLSVSPGPGYVLVRYGAASPLKAGDHVRVYGEYFYPARNEIAPEIRDRNLPGIKAVYMQKMEITLTEARPKPLPYPKEGRGQFHMP
ncbi:hypothetical protein [Methanothermobacter sp. K4]|uniref:hypothetical protein n=1 Tax=Methanothermobacter sp. K4 TaxID=2913262 RepID=UPI001EDB4EEB|nr:hypothetical protein [Methanothermobacter sp. K4]MCG2828073.1 hypothetical protein [Methanothermobacter sp. K4]